MTKGPRVEVAGAAELARGLDHVADNLDNLPNAETQTGQLIVSRARSGAPVESGALSRSIRADTGGEGLTIGSDLVYAGVQEYGWAAHNIVAQPFLRPAAEDTDTWVGFYEDDVQHLLNQVKGA